MQGLRASHFTACLYSVVPDGTFELKAESLKLIFHFPLSVFNFPFSIFYHDFIAENPARLASTDVPVRTSIDFLSDHLDISC